jgi:hypothetical protein
VGAWERARKASPAKAKEKQIVLESFARASWGAAVLRPYMRMKAKSVMAWFATAELLCRLR